MLRLAKIGVDIFDAWLLGAGAFRCVWQLFRTEFALSGECKAASRSRLLSA